MNEDVLATAVGRYDTEPFLDIVPQRPCGQESVGSSCHSDKSEALVGIDFRTWVHVTHLRARATSDGCASYGQPNF